MGSLTLEDLREPGSGASYPCHLLKKDDRALVLFAAGFLGRQDAFWIADAGMDATCVDTDATKLRLMEQLYPPSWAFHQADAFAFAEHAYLQGRLWNVVSLDPPTNLFDDCAKELRTWCALAEDTVVMGVGLDTTWHAPTGWHTTDVRKRSRFQGGVFWAVLRRKGS